MKDILSQTDKEQIRSMGIRDEQIEWQLKVFTEGIPFVRLNRAATIGDGILQLDDTERVRLTNAYDQARAIKKMKFVPASGAASRMFKALFDYLNTANEGDSNDPVISSFMLGLKDFAFFKELTEVLSQNGKSINDLFVHGQYKDIVSGLIYPEGLDYGALPKGLLSFHNYDNGSRTAFEEHLVEGANYAESEGALVYMHFTVSPEHLNKFKTLLDQVREKFEERFNIRYKIEFSQQQASTDTMAVDIHNHPFRESDGSILFRPGGHGALINNLELLDADIIFIKNIDNVVPEKYLKPTVEYKKVLAGKLLEIQKQVFGMLEELESNTINAARLQEIGNFVAKDLCYELSKPLDYTRVEAAKENLIAILHRPIRVCGVVKNLGEPGGGPFWAPNSLGDISLQIIESSQVDVHDPKQENIFREATHFNPVDLVCATKDCKGNKFDLKKYVDPSTCFISHKSKDGNELKALELPGLWNGAMADWLTLFVEVPVETFNPVKTVNDLLRPEHQ